MNISKIKIGERGIENPPTLKDKIKCFFGRHNMFVVKKLSDGCQKIKCTKCQKYWAINHRIETVIPWDKDVEDFYKSFERDINFLKNRDL